jgi:opacity protein-like surface antigen
MQRTKFTAAFLAVLLAVCFAAASADAAIKITIKNNRNHNMTFAFRWSGFDLPDDRRSGWYNVPSGESKTFTFKDADYFLTAQDFGYYATGGGKVWQGKSGDERPLDVIINPNGKFSGHPDDPITGGKKVFFRHVALKETGANDATATLTFNP